jgi:hypothetical protein
MSATLTAKLQLKNGNSLRVSNAPQGMRGLLGERLQGVRLSNASSTDAVLLFVRDLKEAGELVPKAVMSIREGGLVWIAYPKGTSSIRTDVNRDTLRETLHTLGWETVRIIALDETWSALRFRPFSERGR